MAILNRGLPIPLYHQLKTLILEEIEAGRWKPDQQLPTEEQLSARFGVSKITVRQALRELSYAGWIRREQGRGTFVQRPALDEGPRKLTGFTDEMRDRGIAATSQVLDKGVLAAPSNVAAKLQIASGDPVFRLHRLRLADGAPMGIQTTYLPLEMVPGIEALTFDNLSLYEVLRSRYDLDPAIAKETLIAVVVKSEDATLLRVPVGAPALAAERIAYLNHSRPLEYTESIMRGDRYRIVLDLSRHPGA